MPLSQGEATLACDVAFPPGMTSELLDFETSQNLALLPSLQLIEAEAGRRRTAPPGHDQALELRLGDC